MRWTWTVAGLLLVAACGNDSDDNSAFCENVEEVASILGDTNDPGSVDELKANIARIERLQSDLVSTAPGSIRDDVEIVMTTDSDTIRASEQEQLAESRVKVNEYIRSECDLTVEL